MEQFLQAGGIAGMERQATLAPTESSTPAPGDRPQQLPHGPLEDPIEFVEVVVADQDHTEFVAPEAPT